jgi:hypothetical protein
MMASTDEGGSSSGVEEGREVEKVLKRMKPESWIEEMEGTETGGSQDGREGRRLINDKERTRVGGEERRGGRR